MTETFIPKSSNLAEVTYDSGTQEMTVSFKTGQAWKYRGVPQATFLGIQNASSAGSYFWKNIRSTYPGDEV
jgi:KTSC domain